MSVIHGVRYDLIITERNCNKYWYLWKDMQWEYFLHQYHWHMARRRTLIKWLLDLQLKEFNHG